MADGGLRKLFRSHLPSIHWNSIETGLTEPGVPDSNYCYGGIEGWVEHKATSGHAVRVRTEQVGWILRRTRAGGRVFIAVRQVCGGNRRRAMCDDLWLIEGRFVRELRTNGLKELPPTMIAGRWSGGPLQWHWAEIQRILIR